MNDEKKQAMDELDILRSEALELQQRRKDSAAEGQSRHDVPDSCAGEEGQSEQPEDFRDKIEGLAAYTGDLVQELEEAASENPALALLAAFGIGVIVGQLISHRGKEA